MHGCIVITTETMPEASCEIKSILYSASACKVSSNSNAIIATMKEQTNPIDTLSMSAALSD